MVVPIPKQVIIKKPVKNDQVTALFYKWRFYFQMEAQKYPFFCSGRVGGSIMVFQIPKTGYNKNSGKN